ncbi:MAG: PIN domain-containing protein [Cyanobacteria bacterium P01_G01_bin.49]
MDRKVIADTSGIIAFLDRDDHYHSLAVNIVANYQIYIPVTVLLEVDYLATKYLGERVARSFIEDLGDGSFNYLNIESNEIDKITKLMKRYKDLPLGFVDASLVVLVERHQIQSILTLDRRHFNLIQSEQVKYLEILP